MLKSEKKLSTDDIGTLLFMASLIFGAWFRIYPPFAAGFPINDGGLFYKMIEALQQNNFRLPEYVQYNGLNIPFAYPPFAFYLAGSISKAFDVSLFQILLWMPAVILIAVIPAIFHLSNLLLKSRLQAGLAAFLYAMLPRSITWLIMGGGVTRSLGQLFLILASINIYLLFTAKQKKHLAFSVLFSALVCVTHPEATIHTLGIALLLWLFYGRNKEGIANTILVAIGTLLLTSPWWITILLRFGLDPYLSAAQTGLNSANYFIVLFVPFSGEPFLTIIAFLAILGIGVKVAKGDYLLPIWYALPFILEPRNAANVSIIPMAILASIALTELLLPLLSKLEGTKRNLQFNSFLQSRAEKLIFAYILMCLLIGMQYFDLSFRQNRVSPQHHDAFEWIKMNAPSDSKFLILTGKTDLFADYLNEWFPVLTDRRSLTTIQGYEWMGDGLFAKNVESMQGLQQCPVKDGVLNCIESIAKQAELDYDYIYVARINGDITWGDNLIYELQNRDQYTQSYFNQYSAIFDYKR